MKILFYIDCLHSGGKERRLTEMLKALKEVPGISYELAVMSRDIYFKEVLDLEIDIHYLIRKSKKDITILYSLFKLCKRIKPDIIHCWDSMTAIYSIPVCKVLGISLINGMVINAPNQRNLLNKDWRRAKLSFPFSDRIVGNSEAGVAAYAAPTGKSRVIKNGFNFNRIRQITDSAAIRYELLINTKFIVGMVASFSHNKDYKTYFASADLILNRRNDVTFIAIGSNTDSDEVKQLINIDKVNNFRLLGKRNGIESFINTFDVCVLATFTEGISNAILEYMAMAKPVVATDGGGTKELVIHGETGFLVRPSDPSELSTRINELLDIDHLRYEMGTAGRKRIETDFSMRKMVERYILLYNEVTDRDK